MAPTETKGMPVCCEEKDRLQREYLIATADVTRAAQVLQQYTGSMLLDEYKRLRNFTEETRAKCEQVRLELERHMKEHGC